MKKTRKTIAFLSLLLAVCLSACTSHHTRPHKTDWLLKTLKRKIDLSEKQSAILKKEIDLIESSLGSSKEETRKVFLEYLISESSDTSNLSNHIDKELERIRENKQAILGSLQKIHQSLSAEQKAELGNLFEKIANR